AQHNAAEEEKRCDTRHAVCCREGGGVRQHRRQTILRARLPVWIASLLHAAKRLRSDRARRKKVYRLLHRKLVLHGVGVKEGNFQPTYVFPEEVKMLVRSVFSQNILDYPDPCHDQVLHVTVEDLHKLEIKCKV
ncbi:hypothetical protein GBF38_017414, partial [Nibea albiflora]